MRHSAPRQLDHEDAARQDERTRIARDIHDDLGGNLIAVKMALARLAAHLPAGEPALAGQVQYIDDLVERTIESVHRISLGLRASTLELGLVAALAWQAREFARQTGIAVVTHCPDRLDLAPDHAEALFRISQEALTNVARHAGATRVTLTLQPEGSDLTLSICDNGSGLEPAGRHDPHSLGLRGMAERATGIGGTLVLSPAPGGGTMVLVKIRLAPPPAPAQNKKRND